MPWQSLLIANSIRTTVSFRGEAFAMFNLTSQLLIAKLQPEKPKDTQLQLETH